MGPQRQRARNSFLQISAPPSEKKDRASPLLHCAAAKVKIEEFFHLLQPHQNVGGKQTIMKGFYQFLKIWKEEKKKTKEKQQLMNQVTDNYNLVRIMYPNLKL